MTPWLLYQGHRRPLAWHACFESHLVPPCMGSASLMYQPPEGGTCGFEGLRTKQRLRIVTLATTLVCLETLRHHLEKGQRLYQVTNDHAEVVLLSKRRPGAGFNRRTFPFLGGRNGPRKHCSNQWRATRNLSRTSASLTVAFSGASPSCAAVCWPLLRLETGEAG